MQALLCLHEYMNFYKCHNFCTSDYFPKRMEQSCFSSQAWSGPRRIPAKAIDARPPPYTRSVPRRIPAPSPAVYPLRLPPYTHHGHRRAAPAVYPLRPPPYTRSVPRRIPAPSSAVYPLRPPPYTRSVPRRIPVPAPADVKLSVDVQCIFNHSASPEKVTINSQHTNTMS